MKSFERMFELFLVWCRNTNENYNSEWVYTKDKIYQDGEDKTEDYKKWLDIKLSKGETDWLEEMNAE